MKTTKQQPRKPGRPKQESTLTKVSVMLPDEAIAILDDSARRLGLNPSSYIRMVMLEHIARSKGSRLSDLG